MVRNINRKSLIKQHYSTISSSDRSKTLLYLYVKYETRRNVAHAGFQKQNKGTLVTHNSINKSNILNILYLHQAITGKLNQTIGKTHNYPSVPKSYSTTCNGIGGHKKVEKISKSKTTTLTYLII